MVILGSPSDFKIILNNYITMLSLNSKISKGLEAHYLNHFKLKLEEFSAKQFASEIKTKGFIAHDTDDKVVLFEEGKKIASTWKDSIFIETSGGDDLNQARFAKRQRARLVDDKRVDLFH